MLIFTNEGRPVYIPINITVANSIRIVVDYTNSVAKLSPRCSCLIFRYFTLLEVFGLDLVVVRRFPESFYKIRGVVVTAASNAFSVAESSCFCKRLKDKRSTIFTVQSV